MGKSRNKKSEQSEQRQEMPDEMNEEEDPPNSSAITALQSEMAQIKSDIYAVIDSRIKCVYTDLREEIAAAKKDMQTSI